MTVASLSGALLAGASALALVRAVGVGVGNGALRPGGRVAREGVRRSRSGPDARGTRQTLVDLPIATRARVAVVAVVLGLAAAVLGPVGAVGAVIAAAVARAALLRRARRRRDQAVDQAMPELIGLFVVAAAAGHPVAACVEAVAVRAPPAVRPQLAEVSRRVARGAPLGASLERLGPALGTLGPALVEALAGAHRTGAPLAPVLRRAAATARDRRVRAAEEAARRLPVTLLFPLVCCVLPAFALLAVVPLLAGSLDALQP